MLPRGRGDGHTHLPWSPEVTRSMMHGRQYSIHWALSHLESKRWVWISGSVTKAQVDTGW